MTVEHSRSHRAFASTILSLLALSGCYTLQDQLNAGLELPEAVRQNNTFIITSGSVSETNEWDFLPALVTAVVAGAASGSTQFGVDSLSWFGGPAQYKIPPSSPRAGVTSVDMYGVFEESLQRTLPGAAVAKPPTLPPDRVELVPAVALRTENANVYVLCTVVANQYIAGKAVWSRPYMVSGGSVPPFSATHKLGPQEFRGYAAQCLSDALRGYRMHMSGELRQAFLTGKAVPATAYFSQDRGQRGLYLVDADSQYAYTFGARAGSPGPSQGSITTVPLRHMYKFERQ